MRKTIMKTGTTITTDEELESTLGRYAAAMLQHEALTLDLEERIRQIRAEYEERFAPLAATGEAILKDMAAWAALNPERFREKKSLELLHGTVGFRTGMPRVSLARGAKEEDVVAEMLEAGDAEAYLRRVVELDRQRIIAAWSGDDAATKALLGRFGIDVKQSERFYADIKREEAAS
jgi:phage host-nuclease inhibitor protein Gam